LHSYLLHDIKSRKADLDAANSIVGIFIGYLITKEKRNYYCAVGKGMRAISIAGDVYPCHRFVGLEDMKQGNIENYTVGDINDYHRTVVDSLSECKSCWVRYVCGGGCFYKNKASRGDIRLPDNSFCEQIQTLMEIAIDLYLQMDDGDKKHIKQCVDV